MFITSNSYNCNDIRLGPFRQAVYILVYSIENRSRLKAFQLTIYWKRKLSLLSIYLSYFFFHAGNGQRRNSHLRHHSAVLSFIRHDLHIACHIFQIQVRAPKFNNYADTAICMKKCLCWLLMHVLNLWRMHTKKNQTVVKISNLIVQIYHSYQNTFAN